MDVADDTMTVDEKTDAGPVAVAPIQPPLFERAPIRIDGDRKFETEFLRVFFYRLQAQRFVGFVMIKTNYFQAASVKLAVKLVQGGRRCPAIGTIRRGPPPHQDDPPLQFREFERLGVEPVSDLPLGRLGSNQ